MGSVQTVGIKGGEQEMLESGKVYNSFEELYQVLKNEEESQKRVKSKRKVREQPVLDPSGKVELEPALKE